MNLPEVWVSESHDLEPTRNERIANTVQKLFADLEKGYILDLNDKRISPGQAACVGISDNNIHYAVSAGQAERKRDARVGQAMVIQYVDPEKGMPLRHCISFGRNRIRYSGDDLEATIDSLGKASVNPQLTQKMYDFSAAVGESIRWPINKNSPQL